MEVIRYEVKQTWGDGGTTIGYFLDWKSVVSFLAASDCAWYQIWSLIRTEINDHHADREIAAYRNQQLAKHWTD